MDGPFEHAFYIIFATFPWQNCLIVPLVKTETITEGNYFSNLLGNGIIKIIKDIRDSHGKDSDTGDQITPVDDMLRQFEELQKADSAPQAQRAMYRKLFKIIFTKMDPYEFKTFTDILHKYSDLW